MTVVTQVYDQSDANTKLNAGADISAFAGPADAVDLATPLRTLQAISKGQNVNVRVSFSASAVATVDVYIVRYVQIGGSTILVGHTIEAALSATDRQNGARFESEVLVFDAAGAEFYEIRLGAPSAGDVDVYTWVS